MSRDLIIAIPKITTPVVIGGEWLKKRDSLIEDANKYLTIDDNGGYELASNVLQQITTASKALEKMRKDLGQPFLDAGKAIKKVADDARQPLETAKKELQSALSVYITEQRRIADEEERRIEEEQRKADEKARAKKKRLEKQGRIDEAEAVVAPCVAISSPIAVEPTSLATRVSKTIAWDVRDLEQIPEEFKSFEPKKLNAWVRMKGDVIKGKLNNDSDGTDIVPGIRFRLETKVVSRG